MIYMKKKGVCSCSIGLAIHSILQWDIQLDSVFRVLEPVVGKINERTKAPVSLSSRLGLRQPRSEWFRVYRVRIPHVPLTIIPEIDVIS